MKTFKELTDCINENVNSIMMAYDSAVDFRIAERPESIILNKVVVKDKKSGMGTKFMNTLTGYADSVGKRIELDPSTDFGGTSKGRLQKFYKKFGFVDNKGRNKDYEISHSMYRMPR